MSHSRFVGVAGLGLALAGCYTLQPVRGTAPDVGGRIAMDINDAGRVALGGSMGPEISQIEGQLLEKDSAEYLMSVSSIRLLRGGEQTWSGEKVHIKSEYVSSFYERRFSRGRSLALGAVGVGAIAYFVTRSLVTGSSTPDTQIPGDTAHTQRIPVP